MAFYYCKYKEFKSSWVRASQIYSNIYPTRCNFTQFIHSWKLLYMFRVLLPPIIRCAYECMYSIWYLSHRYCYLQLSWRSWNRFECAVGGVRHPQHTQSGLCDASCWIYIRMFLQVFSSSSSILDQFILNVWTSLNACIGFFEASWSIVSSSYAVLFTQQLFASHNSFPYTLKKKGVLSIAM